MLCEASWETNNPRSVSKSYNIISSDGMSGDAPLQLQIVYLMLCSQSSRYDKLVAELRQSVANQEYLINDFLERASLICEEAAGTAAFE